MTDHFSGRALTGVAPSQSTHCTTLHVLFLPRSPSLPVRMLAWPTVTEGTEGRLRCFGRGCRCRCSAAQHRQRHCHFYKDCCADFHCLLPVLVCAESAVDVKRYRFVSGFEEREIRQSSTMCLIQLPNRRAWKSRAISERGSTYCGFTSEGLVRDV